MTSNEKLSAAEAVAAVMADVQAVGKDNTTQGGGPSYQYRSIDGLINGIAPAIHRHGLVLVPHVVECEIVPMVGRNGWTETRATIEYDVVGPDGSTLPRPVRVFAIGADNGDKGPGKAMSYAYKSAISQLLCIPTHDPAQDNEHALIPDAAPVITREMVNELRGVFAVLREPELSDAKNMWMNQVGSPMSIPLYGYDTAHDAALKIVAEYKASEETTIEGQEQ